MWRRRPTVYTYFLLFASALVFLLVVLYNGRTDYGHTSVDHNEALNIQQQLKLKVLKFELRSKKEQRQGDAKPSKTLHASNGSDDSFLASSSNFSDDEIRERPSDLTGDNAKEVRVSSSTDNNPHNSEDDVQDNVQDNVQGHVQEGPNHVRGLAEQARTKKLTGEERKVEERKMEVKEEVMVKQEPGLKRLFLNDWDENNPRAWEELPLATGLEKAEAGGAIVYNRVGKCGSRSVINILRQLALKNRFHLVSSQVYNKTRISPQYEEKMVNQISQLERPYVFQRHLHFIDFRRYRVEQPKYINIIRDPLSRMVSQYYFKRFGDGKSEREYSGDDKFQTFDECVLKQKLECIGKRSFYIIPFFCGQDPRCKEATTWSLNEAMQNVKDFYVALGLLEELEDTFKVFEAVLPKVFNGAMDVYRKTVSGEMHTNISVMFTKHKVRPSPEVAKIMKEHLKLEYIFYEFVKQRFHTQKMNLGIS